jgi:ankyrin repeat protein
LVGQDPGLLEARDFDDKTPLMLACITGQMEMTRLLLDKGAALDERDEDGNAALARELAWPCLRGELLMERGADPTFADTEGYTPLQLASNKGHLPVVRLLLNLPSGKATINHRNGHGATALSTACFRGHGGWARALLESGADPTIADEGGATPRAKTQQDPPPFWISAEGRRECVVALEVRSCLARSLPSAPPYYAAR